MARKGLITEISHDGYTFEEGSTGTGQVLDTEYGPAFEWGETIQDERGSFTLIYRGDIPDDVIEDLDLDAETIASICSTVGMDPDKYRQLAVDPDPVARFGALQIYAMHYGWGELDNYPLQMHPILADERFDGIDSLNPDEVEVIDHGAEHCQYFQGCGVAFTRFNHVITGCGDTPREAFEDALDQLEDVAPGAFRVAAGDLSDESDIPEAEDGDGSPEWFHYVSIRW